MTHGTPTGYDAGCHGSAECANHRTGLMTCAEARTRYRGDYSYRKAVDAGTATAERETFAKPVKVKRVVVETKAEAAKRPAKIKAAPNRAATPRKPKTVKGPRTPRELVHGTPYGATRCKTDCPNEAKGLITCRQASRDWQNAYAARRRAGNGAPIVHGTSTGYQMGCHDRAKCPAEVTCSDAVRDRERARTRSKGIKPRTVVVHGTASGYRTFPCRSRTECPAAIAGGKSCCEVNSAAVVAKTKARLARAA